MFSTDPNLPAAPAPQDLSFDVTEADFRQTVLERSLEVPVLLDCWAPWCGPCRNLKPLLEKLVQAYGGRFVLAKLNTDEAPQISAALQIRSIPLVVLFVGGRPVDQFMGAQPEGQIRQFLDKHLGPQVSEAEQIRLEAAEAPDAETAEALLREALSSEPDNAAVLLDLAERVIAYRDRGESLPRIALRLCKENIRSADGSWLRPSHVRRLEIAARAGYPRIARRSLQASAQTCSPHGSGSDVLPTET
jgi:putative thioredoxin